MHKGLTQEQISGLAERFEGQSYLPASEVLSDSELKQARERFRCSLPEGFLSDMVVVYQSRGEYDLRALILPREVARHYGVGMERSDSVAIQEYVNSSVKAHIESEAVRKRNSAEAELKIKQGKLKKAEQKLGSLDEMINGLEQDREKAQSSNEKNRINAQLKRVNSYRQKSYDTVERLQRQINNGNEDGIGSLVDYALLVREHEDKLLRSAQQDLVITEVKEHESPKRKMSLGMKLGLCLGAIACAGALYFGYRFVKPEARTKYVQGYGPAISLIKDKHVMKRGRSGSPGEFLRAKMIRTKIINSLFTKYREGTWHYKFNPKTRQVFAEYKNGKYAIGSMSTHLAKNWEQRAKDEPHVIGLNYRLNGDMWEEHDYVRFMGDGSVKRLKTRRRQVSRQEVRKHLKKMRPQLIYRVPAVNAARNSMPVFNIDYERGSRKIIINYKKFDLEEVLKPSGEGFDAIPDFALQLKKHRFYFDMDLSKGAARSRNDTLRCIAPRAWEKYGPTIDFAMGDWNVPIVNPGLDLSGAFQMPRMSYNRNTGVLTIGDDSFKLGKNPPGYFDNNTDWTMKESHLSFMFDINGRTGDVRMIADDARHPAAIFTYTPAYTVGNWKLMPDFKAKKFIAEYFVNRQKKAQFTAPIPDDWKEYPPKSSHFITVGYRHDEVDESLNEVVQYVKLGPSGYGHWKTEAKVGTNEVWEYLQKKGIGLYIHYPNPRVRKMTPVGLLRLEYDQARRRLSVYKDNNPKPTTHHMQGILMNAKRDALPDFAIRYPDGQLHYFDLDVHRGSVYRSDSTPPGMWAFSKQAIKKFLPLMKYITKNKKIPIVDVR